MSTKHTPELEEEETPLSEIVKADIPRVDGVMGPANGRPFLLIKASGDDLVTCPTCGGTGKITKEKAAELKKAVEENHMHEPVEGDAQKAEQQPADWVDQPTEPVAKDLEVDVEVVKAPCEMPEVCEPDDVEEAAAEPVQLFDGDGEIQLQGDEAMHNVPLNNAIAAIKTLMTQEIGEPSDESWDVDSLNCILRMLYAWAAGEAWEGEQDVVDGALGKAGARLSAASTSAIQAALKHLQDLLDGPAGGTKAPAKNAADDNADAAPSEPSSTDSGDAKKAAEPKEAPVADTPKEAAAVAETTEDLTKAEAKVEEVEKAAKPAEDDNVEDDTNDSEESGEEEAEKVKKAAAPAAPALTLEDVQKAMGDVLKSMFAEELKKAIEPFEQRLAKVEETPLPGGPFLNGRAQDTADYVVVRKGQGQQMIQRTPEELVKALGEVENPKDRERIGRILAESSHPFHRSAQ